MKKAGLLMFCLISLFGITYVAANKLNAMTNTSATIAPFAVGDTFMLSSWGDEEREWEILTEKNGYFTMMTTKVLDDDLSHSTQRCEWHTDGTAPNSQGNSMTDYHLQYCNYNTAGAESKEYLALKAMNVDITTAEKSIIKEQTDSDYVNIDQPYIFIPIKSDIGNGGALGFTSNAERAFYTRYYLHPKERGTFIDGMRKSQTGSAFVGTDGTDTGYTWSGFFNTTTGNTYAGGYTRPAIVVEKSKLLYAIGIDTTIGELYKMNEASGKQKVRVENTSYHATLQSLDQTLIGRGSKLGIHADANAGTNQYVSVLLFDQTGMNLLYYRTTQKANGSDTYYFDTTGVDIGNYKLAIVNEQVDVSTNRPAFSSVISSKLDLEIVDPLIKLDTSKTPQPDTNGNSLSMFAQDENVTAGSQIMTAQSYVEHMSAGTTTQIPATYPVTYDFVEDSNGRNDAFNNIQFRMNGSAYAVDASGNLIIEAMRDLPAGVYHFRVRAMDQYGNPFISQAGSSYGVDNQGQVVTQVAKGLVGDDVELLVFPSDLTYSAKLSNNGTPADASDDRNYQQPEINANPQTVLGIAQLQTALPTDLQNLGYQVQYHMENLRIDGTLTTNADVKIDMNTGQVKAISGVNIQEGEHKFDVVVKFVKGSDVSSFKLKDCSFSIDPRVYFVDPHEKDGSGNTVPDANKASIQSYQVTYVANGSFDLLALGTGNLLYQVSANQPSGYQSGAIQIPNASVGSAQMNTLGKVRVDAYKMLQGTPHIYATLDIEIVHQAQNIHWEGTNAQSEVFMQYTTNATMTIQELAQGDPIPGGMRLGVRKQGTGPMIYTSETPAVCRINGTVVTMLSKGICKIKAKQDADATYAPSNEIIASIITRELTFTQLHSITAGTSSAAAQAAVGTLRVDPTMNGFTYGIDRTYGTAGAAFDVETNGTVKIGVAALSSGNYTVKLTAMNTTTGEHLELIQTITVAQGSISGVQWEETTNPGAAITQVQKNFGDPNFTLTVTGSGLPNGATITYQLKDPNDHMYLTISNTGLVSIVGATPTGGVLVEATITAPGYQSTTMDIPVHIAKCTQSFRYVDQTNTELPKTGSAYDPIVNTFVKNGLIPLFTNGGVGTITFSLKQTDMMIAGTSKTLADVVSVNAGTGELTILHASLNYQIGNVIIVAQASGDANTEPASIELPVNIVQAKQDSFAFSSSIITVYSGQGSVTPAFVNQGAGNTGPLMLSVPSSSSGLVWVDPATNTDFIYDAQGPMDLIVEAQQVGDRDFENSPKVQATLRVLEPGSTPFTVNVGRVYYANEQFEKVTFQPFSVPGETGVAYTYVSQQPAIAEYDAVLNTIKAYQTGRATFTITKTGFDAGGVALQPATINLEVEIKKRPLKLIADNFTKKVGEAVPSFTYTIDAGTPMAAGDALTSGISLICKDGSTHVNAMSSGPSYPILLMADASQYPNYDISTIDGLLQVTQDMSLPTWYEVRPGAANGTATSYQPQTGWYNGPVDVALLPASGSYDQIGPNGNSGWDPVSFSITAEGINQQTIYFKDSVSGAISKPASEEIKIDATSPVITSITGQETNKNAIADFLHMITGGLILKPGVEIEVKVDDPAPSAGVQVSGVHHVAYEIFKINADDTPDLSAPYLQGTITSIANQVGHITIPDYGKYRVCAIPIDGADNRGTEKCSDLMIKKINVDIDGDGSDDFLDPDEDGCPDVNIKWPNEQEGTWVELNIDRNHDGLPDLNIDTDGDGVADLNIDTDHDGIPDLNLVQIKEWKPTVCVTNQLEEYCTMSGLEPSLNVDLDHDGIPDIDIDSDGDGKADINISTDGKTPSINIVLGLQVWKPDQIFTVDGFTYDTMQLQPTINVDSNGDGCPDLNIDLDQDSIADLNIDTNGDGIPEINIDVHGKNS